MNSEQPISAILRDRYELQSTLGEGGSGMVYKARQLTTGQPVAIKVLRLPADGTSQSHDKRVVRFQREMQLCAQLHHPNIVRLIDSGEADGRIVYSIFEFVPGKDLAQVLADEGRLDPSEARHLMLQVLDALACAHGQGVVHRDLKPANLMISPTGARRNALVLDFGIGALAHTEGPGDSARLTLTSESIGTPSYSAPEQLRGLLPTPRADLYAWGLVFLECLTGKRVIEGETMAEVVYKQLSPEPIPIPPDIASHPLGSILRRATVKDPAARDVTAEGLLRELEACDVSGLRVRLGSARLQPSAASGETRTEGAGSEERGRATSPRLVEGERRQITALCCTLGVSGPRKQAADPEELDQILGVQQEACIAMARRFGGHVAGVMGDTLLFYFGYPTAREDDARRAARAALATSAELRVRGTALQAERGMRLDFRFGLHTGLVVTRELRDPTNMGPGYVVGATPMLATRLSAQAAPGTIVLSGETRRLLRRDFLLEAQGVQPPSEDEPALETYLLHEGNPSAEVDDVTLVGRERELQVLVDGWSRARGGTGQAILLTGEPGIGKSRLARELAGHMGDEPHAWLECRCTPDSANTAFYPIIDLLDRLLDPVRRTTPEGKVERLEALLSLYGFELSEAMPLFGPLLSLSLPARWPPLNVSPQRQRELTRNAVLSLLFEIAEREPVVLLVEDLQWVDPSTLELLGQFVGELASSRLLALFTARPEFTPTWSSTAASQLQLTRLGRLEIEQLLTKMTGGRALPAEVLEQLASRTEGVPLFVEEFIRAMLESGALVEQGERYLLARPLRDLSIPTTLRDSLVARLDRLGRAKETAQVASAIGREFTFELLRAISPWDESAVQEDLEKLVASELVYRKRRLRNPAYFFKHALVRDAAYESMLKRSRQQVHLRIARALEEKFPELTRERPELLAQHHAAAGQPREALGYAQKAAMAALSRSANAEAIGHAREALGWLEQISDPRERAELELALNGITTPALMASQGWRSTELKRTVDRSQELLGVVGDSPHVAPTLWISGLYYHVGGRDRAKVQELIERLLTLCRQRGDSGMEAAILPMDAHSAMLAGAYARARESAERALALYNAERHAEHRFMYGQDTKTSASVVLCHTLWYMGYPDQSLAHGQAALQWARELNHPNSTALSYLYLMVLYCERREPDQVLRLGEALTAVAQKHGLLQQMLYVGLLCDWAQGNLQGVRSTISRLEQLGNELNLSFYRSLAARLEAASGAYDAAFARLESAMRQAEESGERYSLPALLDAKGRLLLERGAPHEASDECFHRALALAREHGSRMMELQAATSLARSLGVRGRADEARALLSPVLGWFTEGFDTTQVVEAQRLLAALGGTTSGSGQVPA